jgi:hypothetical protein
VHGIPRYSLRATGSPLLSDAPLAIVSDYAGLVTALRRRMVERAVPIEGPGCRPEA